MPDETILNGMLAAQAGGEATYCFEIESFPSTGASEGGDAVRIFAQELLVADAFPGHGANPIELGVNIAAVLSMTFNKRFQRPSGKSTFLAVKAPLVAEFVEPKAGVGVLWQRFGRVMIFVERYRYFGPPRSR